MKRLALFLMIFLAVSVGQAQYQNAFLTILSDNSGMLMSTSLTPAQLATLDSASWLLPNIALKATLAQYSGLSDTTLALQTSKQNVDPDLTGLAGLSTTGTVRRTGAGTFTATASDTVGLALLLAQKANLQTLLDSLNAWQVRAAGLNWAANQWVVTDGADTSHSIAVTASRAVVSDANGLPAASAVTATELGYLDNATSEIQTQLNGKVAKADIYTLGSPLGLDSSMTVVGRIIPLFVGNNETVDSVKVMLAGGTIHIHFNIFSGTTIGTATDSLFTANWNPTTANGVEAKVTADCRNSGSLGYKYWWLKVNDSANKPDAWAIQFKVHRP